MLVILYKKNAKGTLNYYVLDDRQPSLFSPWTLNVGWGKAPDASPRKHYSFDSLEEKNKKIRSLMGRKLKDYQVLYSYFKNAAERVRSSKDNSSELPGLKVIKS